MDSSVDCKGCRGSGNCNLCGGDGWKYNIRDKNGPSKIDCWKCNGTGVCPGCSGSGIIVLKDSTLIRS